MNNKQTSTKKSAKATHFEYMYTLKDQIIQN